MSAPDESTRPPRGAGAAHTHAAALSPDPAGDGVAGHVDPAPPTLVGRGMAAFDWWQRSRPGRALVRFGARGGRVLTGGIAYAALFSVFAVLTIGWSVFTAIVGNNEELLNRMLRAIDSVLPGLVDTPESEGLIDPSDLQLTVTTSVAGVVAVGVLVLSALAATAALRTGVRAMFGHEAVGPEAAVMGRVRALGGLIAIALAVVLSALLTTAFGTVLHWVLDLLGWSGSGNLLLRAGGLAVAFTIDAAMFVLIVVVLGGEDPPRRDLLLGSVFAATAMGVIRYLGTSVVSGAIDRTPVLATFAVAVTLLLWVNLMARIVLLVAAWVADPPTMPRGRGAEVPTPT
ncbi:YihY/virulence factor BrkB family protein [Cellulomonas composti]|uniref:Uncharacterized protein n=1 Tax=Cellulomonas composti TaxID=266130 RepID=A0A511JCI2_9CELL|nr:YihY/virulence factor BrkB family protein [Cellulomonas composti]GEL95686.1 hypothetical protein CCO02nite_23440 [Cellulomonas composti]